MKRNKTATSTLHDMASTPGHYPSSNDDLCPDTDGGADVSGAEHSEYEGGTTGLDPDDDIPSTSAPRRNTFVQRSLLRPVATTVDSTATATKPTYTRPTSVNRSTSDQDDSDLDSNLNAPQLPLRSHLPKRKATPSSQRDSTTTTAAGFQRAAVPTRAGLSVTGSSDALTVAGRRALFENGPQPSPSSGATTDVSDLKTPLQRVKSPLPAAPQETAVKKADVATASSSDGSEADEKSCEDLEEESGESIDGEVIGPEDEAGTIEEEEEGEEEGEESEPEEENPIPTPTEKPASRAPSVHEGLTSSEDRKNSKTPIAKATTHITSSKPLVQHDAHDTKAESSEDSEESDDYDSSVDTDDEESKSVAPEQVPSAMPSRAPSIVEESYDDDDEDSTSEAEDPLPTKPPGKVHIKPNSPTAPQSPAADKEAENPTRAPTPASSIKLAENDDSSDEESESDQIDAEDEQDPVPGAVSEAGLDNEEIEPAEQPAATEVSDTKGKSPELPGFPIAARKIDPLPVTVETAPASVADTDQPEDVAPNPPNPSVNDTAEAAKVDTPVVEAVEDEKAASPSPIAPPAENEADEVVEVTTSQDDPVDDEGESSKVNDDNHDGGEAHEDANENDPDQPEPEVTEQSEQAASDAGEYITFETHDPKDRVNILEITPEAIVIEPPGPVEDERVEQRDEIESGVDVILADPPVEGKNKGKAKEVTKKSSDDRHHRSSHRTTASNSKSEEKQHRKEKKVKDSKTAGSSTSKKQSAPDTGTSKTSSHRRKSSAAGGSSAAEPKEKRKSGESKETKASRARRVVEMLAGASPIAGHRSYTSKR